MERPSSTSLNGRGHVVLEKEVITDADTLEKTRLAEPKVLLPEEKTSPVVTPDTDPERQQKESTPKRK
jgi:hypothetical protein